MAKAEDPRNQLEYRDLLEQKLLELLHKKHPTIPATKEEPNRMERLCFRALAERVISESKAAELLGIPVREL